MGQTFSNEIMNIEDYLKHLYEMPPSWPDAALQAQAIAARSYALRVYDEKGFLYPSQKDQVIKKELNDGRWQAAVDATRGKVMMNGGRSIKGWFASTAGGFVFNSGDVWGGYTDWTKRARDTNGEVGSFADLLSKAFDKESPCFYAAQGYRSQYGKSAWLKSEEVADIANVILLVQKDSSTSVHLYQVDKPNPEGADNWDANRVRQELKNRGEQPFEKVSDVVISGVDWGTGLTTNVVISGNIIYIMMTWEPHIY